MEFFNWFLNPIQNQYADFEGRATRQQFWMYVLVYLVIFIPVYVIAKTIGLGFLVQLALLAIIVPSWAIGARRLHDTGLSGWLQLLGLIPLLGAIILIVLFARSGEAAENMYGPVPATPAPATGVPPAPVAPATASAPEAAPAAPAPEAAPEQPPAEPTDRV